MKPAHVEESPSHGVVKLRVESPGAHKEMQLARKASKRTIFLGSVFEGS